MSPSPSVFEAPMFSGAGSRNASVFRRPPTSATSASRHSLVLDLPPALQESVADRPQQQVQQQQADGANPQRRIADAEEAGTETRDHVEEGIRVADLAERGRELLDRIEGAAQ